MIKMVQLGAGIGKGPSDMIWTLKEKDPTLPILFVEPYEPSFLKLKEYYASYPNCYFERCAILPDPQPTEAILYHNINSTCDNAMATTKPGSGRGNHDTVVVPSMSLRDLLDKYKLIGVPFDLLQLDIEEQDAAVVMSTRFRDEVLAHHVRVETVHLGEGVKQLISYMGSSGYDVIDDPYYDLYKSKTGIQAEPKSFNTVFERRAT